MSKTKQQILVVTKKKKPRSRFLSDQSDGKNAFPGLTFSRSEPGMAIRSMPLFGQRTRRTLSYVSNFIGISSGAATAGAYVFSANGLFDPDITSTGTQPMGFDQMMGFFNHYTVLSSKCSVVYSSATAANPVVALAVSGTNTPLTSIEQICEQGKVDWCWLTGTGVANSKACLNAVVDCRKFQGLVNILDDPNMRGDVASNPTEQIYFILYVWYPVDTSVVSAGASVRIEYDVMFHEPRSPPLS